MHSPAEDGIGGGAAGEGAADDGVAFIAPSAVPERQATLSINAVRLSRGGSISLSSNTDAAAASSSGHVVITVASPKSAVIAENAQLKSPNASSFASSPLSGMQPVTLSSSASLSIPSKSSLSSSSPLTSTLTLTQLLSDSRLFPLNQSEFRRFLVRLYVDENLDFLLRVRAFRASLRGLESKAKYGAVEVVKADKLAAIADKDAIVRRFVEPGSEREVNLSSALRKDVQARAAQYNATYRDNANPNNFQAYDFATHKDLPLLSSAFDDAEAEVVRLLEQGGYVQRFYAQQTRNIDAREVQFRKWQGIGLMLLALCLTLVLILTVQQRWWRLLVFPILFIASTSLLTAQCGVCPMLQLQRRMISGGDGAGDWWSVASGKCSEETCGVKDEEVRNDMAKAVRSLSIKGIALAVALTALYVGIPSYVQSG